MTGGSRAASTSMLIHRRAGRSSRCACQRVAAPARHAPASTLIAAPQCGWGRASWAASAMAAETRAAKGPKYRPKKAVAVGCTTTPMLCEPERKLSSTSAETPPPTTPAISWLRRLGRSNSTGSSQASVMTTRTSRPPASSKREIMKPVGVAGRCNHPLPLIRGSGPRRPQGKAQVATGPVQKRGGDAQEPEREGRRGALDSPWPELLDGAAAQKSALQGAGPHGGGDTGRLGASPTRLQTGSGHHPPSLGALHPFGPGPQPCDKPG